MRIRFATEKEIKELGNDHCLDMDVEHKPRIRKGKTLGDARHLPTLTYHDVVFYLGAASTAVFAGVEKLQN